MEAEGQHRSRSRDTALGGADLVSGVLGVLVEAKGIQSWAQYKEVASHITGDSEHSVVGRMQAETGGPEGRVRLQPRAPGSQDRACPEKENLLTKLGSSWSRRPLARSTTTVRRHRQSL